MKPLILIAILFAQLYEMCETAPARFVPVLINGQYQMQRLDPIGNWIQSSDWFPIEINVPDTVSNIGQGISSGIMNIGNGVNSWVQGLPFINRIIAQFRPKPMRYIVLMPMGENSEVKSVQFNPFDNAESHFIPAYP